MRFNGKVQGGVTSLTYKTKLQYFSLIIFSYLDQYNISNSVVMGNQIFFHPLLLRVRPVWQAHYASLNSQNIRIIGGLFVKQVRVNISPHIICHTIVVVDPTTSLRASSSDAESMLETVTFFDSEGVAIRRLPNVPHHCVLRILLYPEGVAKCAWGSSHTKGVAKSIGCSSYTEDVTHAARSTSHPKGVAKSVVSPYP